MQTTKASLCALLRDFILSRPGFAPGNYHTYASYRSDLRSSLRDRDDALKMLCGGFMGASGSGAVTLEHLRVALSSARRLSLSDDGQRLDYSTGQYYPTEYRAAAAAALASAWWNAIRDLLERERKAGHAEYVTGDEIRSYARSRFGHRLARRWFN